jgi:homoserine kinase
MREPRATVFAPASIGNVGPGFDVLGLAVDGLGDLVSVTLVDGPSRVASVRGCDAALVPRDPSTNAASIAARTLLDRAGDRRGAVVRLVKGMAVAGGLGGSAASAVGGALAAAIALGLGGERRLVLEAALAGESAVAGRHLDNVAPCLLGGLALVRSVDPIDVVSLPVRARWWVVLFTPHVRIATRRARKILPAKVGREVWVPQMANALGLAHAFATADAALLSRSLDDRFAEPARARLVPRFREIKAAALGAGAIGCSLSGSGPTLFAIVRDERAARAAAAAMKRALGSASGSSVHVGRISRKGARKR